MLCKTLKEKRDAHYKNVDIRLDDLRRIYPVSEKPFYCVKQYIFIKVCRAQNCNNFTKCHKIKDT